MRVLITGATGFIGRALCAHLSREHDLLAVARNVESARRALDGHAEARALPHSPEEWAAAVDGCNAIVNLAGESIAAGRWTEARKRQILDSRIGVTQGLVRGIESAARKPAVMVSASAVGYYGPHGDEEIDETAAPGSDFLARTCREWEEAAQAAEPAGVRVARLRLGVVLGDGGGALERMVLPFKLFVGGPIGNGRQWLSWIHRDDVIGLVELALREERAAGAMNATAPEPQTMREFSRVLGKVLGRPSWAPVPAVVLKLALGEMSGMLLTGQRVLPRVAQQLGYRFRYGTLEAALAACLGAGG